MNAIRDAILSQMLKLGLSIYQVSKMVEGRVPQRTVYSFLTGDQDAGTKTASAIMDAVGLTITTESDSDITKRGALMKESQPKSFLGRMKVEWYRAGKPDWSLREQVGMCLLVDMELEAEGLNPARKFREAVMSRKFKYIFNWVNGLKFPWA